MIDEPSMASSGPHEQSTHPSPPPPPATTQHSSPDAVLPSFTALVSAVEAVEHVDYFEPYTHNEISAAATLATMSDSRPATSHAEDGWQDEGVEEDFDEGGVSLVDGQSEVFGGNGNVTVHAQSDSDAPGSYSTPTVAVNGSEYYMYALDLGGAESAVPSYSPSVALDHHAAALEALSMDQATPAPPIPSVSQPSSEPTGHAIHNQLQEYAMTPYEDYLSLQDNTAFINPSLFYLQSVPDKMIPLGLEAADGNNLEVVTRDDLRGEECDYQGLLWSKWLSREEFRAKRTRVERSRMENAMRQYGGWKPDPIPNTENFFSFRKMDRRHRPWGPHFQLRNVMAVTSRHDIYYARRLVGIFKTDSSGSEVKPIIDTTKHTVNGSMCTITTMAAKDDVLIAGGFDGEYAVVNLATSDGPRRSMDVIRDWAPDTKSYITNHVHLFSDRSSYTPQAILCSNDNSLRVLDCETNTFKYKFNFKAAINCSATSPDGRLRVVAGDFPETLITNAETGETLQTLHAHAGDAFACAWADDGYHVATAAQDATIAVWDARSWRRPLTILPSELSIPRVLKFSPAGSGPRVLVSAEADDYVSVIDARLFESQQCFDLFGRTGGVDFTPDGRSLFVANSEVGIGGIMELERVGACAPRLRGGARMGDGDGGDKGVVDWGEEDEMDSWGGVVCGGEERGRRGGCGGLGDLWV